MSRNRELQSGVASQLEDLTAMAIEVKRLLREGQEDDLAYALVYQLRWKLGKVLAGMASIGVMVPRSPLIKAANQILEAQRQQ